MNRLAWQLHLHSQDSAMLVSALLIGFIILGLFMSMLSSRPKPDRESAVPVRTHQREDFPLADPDLRESNSTDLLLSQS